MIFDRAMASFSSVVAAAVAAAYDFSSSRTVVDLGGGDGSLLAGILRRDSHLRGVVADVPHVAERSAPKAGSGRPLRGMRDGCRGFLQGMPGATLRSQVDPSRLDR